MPEHAIENDLVDLIGRLVAGPAQPEKAFIRSGMNHADLYCMAAHILAEFAGETAVCLATDDRGVVSAAILAALAGGPRLILPYALSPTVLAEIHALTGYGHAITAGETFPVPGVRAFRPRADRAAWPSEAPPTAIGADAPWIQLFTGGSTGAPRSWPKTVRNLMAETRNIVTTYGIDANDCIVSTASPLHIYGLLYGILAALVTSASIAAGTPSFPAEIEDSVLAHQATVLISLPAHYRALKGHAGRQFPLRMAFSSAGMLDQADAEAFGTFHQVGINEVYGSTETGGVAARNRFRGETDFTTFRPVTVKRVDENLWVRSAFLSPNLPLDDTGFYQIGDRAVFTGPDRFMLTGRSDSVVKVGGKRVDLAEVRDRLMQHPQVSEALVTALPVGRSRENLIVAVVEGAADVESLNTLTAASLEPYARPRRIKVVDRIPVTAAGKYDRRQIEAYFKES
ncbi:Acyl-CoA synthetase (AMP-forming)/AMP-acid ligase II [Desulfosarcina cetonica]|nr:Acyl-CoA synthetase (AMP-forming)/AMP-acid ligase II [Desulfosarcina cetonica]